MGGRWLCPGPAVQRRGGPASDLSRPLKQGLQCEHTVCMLHRLLRPEFTL